MTSLDIQTLIKIFHLGSYKKSSVHSQKPEWEEQNEQQEKDDQNKQQEKEKQTTKDRARQRWKILCLVKTSGDSIYIRTVSS